MRQSAAHEFNPAVNGYRGLCALLVFVFHCGSAGVIAWPSGSLLAGSGAWLWSACRYGVEMFFMISGFVILGSLLRHASVQAFLQDRVVRIFSAWVPTLIVVTLVCVLLSMRVFAEATPLEAVGIFVANLFLLPPLVPLPMIHLVSWSLSYEWVFYLLAASCVLLTRRPSRPGWALPLWAAIAVLFICSFPRALFFVPGALVFTYREWFAAHRAWLRWPLVSLLIFLVAWRYTGVEPAHLTRTLFDFFSDGSWLAAIIAFVAALHTFAATCLDSSRQLAWLKGRTFQFLGTISYSFYLWHSLVMSLTKRLVNAYVVPELGVTTGFALFVTVSLAIALPLSWLSWRLFEVRLATLLRRRLASKPVPAGVVSAH